MGLKKIKIASKSLISRIGGFSLLGVGISWKAPEPERMIVKEVLTFLEDRRALFAHAVMEDPRHVVDSVLRMREQLTDALSRVGDKSPAKDSFRIMRAACRQFFDRPGADEFRRPPPEWRFSGTWAEEEFLIALGQLRSTFGQQIAVLAHLYAIDVEKDLASIMPPAPEDDTEDKTLMRKRPNSVLPRQ